MLNLFGRFVRESAAVVSSGSRPYYLWLMLLVAMIALGVDAYANQATTGLITTHMRDQVSWGFYIGNFAFLVGVAAAAVVLVIPAYIYNFGPLRDVVLIAELLSVAAIVMCMLFVIVDVGRPQLLWHLLPGVGLPNFPFSMLIWDILVLNGYFLINFFIVTYLLFMAYTGRKYHPGFVLPLVFLSIPMAVGIHTVTAMLFMGLVGRTFWNVAILAPRFLSSAFCSGPALLLLIFMILRRVGRFSIADRTLSKIGELLAYAMAANLFFLGVEVFTQFYEVSAHTVHARFQWFGLDGHYGLARFSWLALAFNALALIGFMVPVLRNRLVCLGAACVLAIAGVFIEKGMGLLVPGMTPDMLGEIYIYAPSWNEIAVGIGIWGLGALVFTLMVKVAMAVSLGNMRA